MARATYQSRQMVGPPALGRAAKQIAREIQANLGLEPMGEPFLPECERLIDPIEAEAILRRDLPPSQINSTSDDYTEMTWHAPTSRYYIARPTLRAPARLRLSRLGDERARRPQRDDRSHGDLRRRDVGADRAAADADQTTLAAAKGEFFTRTQGGIGGAAWLAPLCDYPLADRLSVAGICDDRARPRLVDPDAGSAALGEKSDAGAPIDRP